MSLQFVESSRGKLLLCVEQYLYRKDRENSGGQTSWRCMEKACNARIYTIDGCHEGQPVHEHAPNPIDIKVRGHSNRLRANSLQQRSVRPSTVIASVVGGIGSESVSGRMPSMKLLRQRVNYQRRGAGPLLPRNPSRREDLNIPDFLRATTNGENFLFHDSGVGDAERIIVYATPRNIELLKENSEWLMDGTFKVCPSIFYQMYSIHVKLPSGKAVPVLYSFLPSKNPTIYSRLFEVIENALDGFTPQAIHVDFELPVMEEIESRFPETGIIGCNFHLNQAVWRHIQSDGAVRERYVNDDDFNLRIRMFPALAFVPLQDVRELFQMLVSSDFVRDNRDILATFIRYFESTWIGSDFNPARYKLEWWNAYVATRHGLARTNNEMEGWHSAFARRIASNHPCFFKMVEHLRVEQGLTEFLVNNTAATGEREAPRRVYRDRQRRLYDIVSTYETRASPDYLKLIAHNISF